MQFFNNWSSELFTKKSGDAETEDILVYGKDGQSTWAEAKNGDFRVTFIPWIQKTQLFLCPRGHLNASAMISKLLATLPKSAVSRPGSSTFLCSVVDRRTRDRKVAGSILGRSGRRNVFSRVNFVC